MVQPGLKWFSRLRRSSGGRSGRTDGLHLVLSFEADEFRYLLTNRPAGGGSPEVVRWGVVPRDDRSEALWLQAIKDLKLPRVRATAVLPTGDYQVLQIDVPKVPDDELQAAARWRIKDMVSTPVEELTLDVLRLFDAVGRPAAQMLVVVARNDVVLRVMLRCRQAGLLLDAIDIPETGLRNVACLQASSLPAVATLVEADMEFMFSVCAGGELVALRRIPRDVGDELSMRAVGEVTRSIERFERQFPDLSVGGVLLEMGAFNQDYMRALGAETGLLCEPFRADAMLRFGQSDLGDTQLPPAFLALSGASLRGADAAPAGVAKAAA